MSRHRVNRLIAIGIVSLLGLSSTALAIEPSVSSFPGYVQTFNSKTTQPLYQIMQTRLPELVCGFTNLRDEFSERMKEHVQVIRPLEEYGMTSSSAFSLRMDGPEPLSFTGHAGSRTSTLGKWFSNVQFLPNRFTVAQANPPNGMVLFAF